MLKKLAQKNVHLYVNHPCQSKTLSLGLAFVIGAAVPVLMRKTRKSDPTS